MSVVSAYLLKSVTLYVSRSRHGVVAARLTSDRPGRVIPVSKTFTLFVVHFICCISICYFGDF